jgi:succinate dehydrogenase / fumarate reductase, cytochrome b subunit
MYHDFLGTIMTKPESNETALPRRALSPHLQIWRWHITMAASILHRVSGVGSLLGVVLGISFLLCLGIGVLAYTQFLSIMATPLGIGLWMLASLGVFVHTAGGIRHLIWDTTKGLDIKSANLMSLAFPIWAFGVWAAFWSFLFTSGKVVL